LQYLDELLEGLPCSWITLATACRKENVNDLIGISDELSQRYFLYEGLISNSTLELQPTDFNEHQDLLVEYYEKAPASLKRELLKRRNEHGLYLCPFCGAPKKPDTLDHFIPKVQWPEFSIFPNNLVPQCRGCAPIKGENYYCNEEGVAKFIHPIYSNLLQRFRFKITVTFDEVNNKPSFSIVLIRILDAETNEIKRVIFHLKNLKIQQRIIKFCNEDYRRWMRRLSKNRFDLRIALRQRLSEMPENDWGQDWKTAFNKGLLENENAINFLHSLRPSGIRTPQLEVIEELELE
tara:strand:- start:179 stop:1057 length:879 start_codon:yes stop_codon:yes gene_type:complete